jgi:ACT domain-containing protein
LGLKEGMELVVSNNDKKELKIFPLLEGKSAEIKIMMEDVPGALGKTADFLGKHNVDIIMSISKTIERGRSAEWSAIVDTSKCNGYDLKKLKKELGGLKFITKVDILEK